jgi:inositol oxygenase
MQVIQNGPLDSLEQWDDHVKGRYRADRKKEEFRVYDESTPPVVREFYRQNHANQTHDFACAKLAQYVPLRHGRMGIWEAMERLNELVDDSDPDTDLSQIEHNLQTAEAIRAAGHPRWFQLTGFIHDLGKVLTFWGEPQWAVVGDTFPTGCSWSDRIVFPEFFAANPDAAKPELQTQLGVYQAGGGLDQVRMSWGHDEYLYHVTKAYLPEPAQYMIRYHSWYSAHREGDYSYLMTPHDEAMMEWVRTFNPFDLYSKSDAKPQLSELRPYYTDLINEYFPEKIDW